jgi:hypothetical protein
MRSFVRDFNVEKTIVLSKYGQYFAKIWKMAQMKDLENFFLEKV